MIEKLDTFPMPTHHPHRAQEGYKSNKEMTAVLKL